MSASSRSPWTRRRKTMRSRDSRSRRKEWKDTIRSYHWIKFLLPRRRGKVSRAFFSRIITSRTCPSKGSSMMPISVWRKSRFWATEPLNWMLKAPPREHPGHSKWKKSKNTRTKIYFYESGLIAPPYWLYIKKNKIKVDKYYLGVNKIIWKLFVFHYHDL